MNTARPVIPGKTRACPHCKATILDSASVCPACNHHLRFESDARRRPQRTYSPLRVEGTIKHPPVGEAWEYSVVISIRNDRGEETDRHVVGVGALHPSEGRTFTLSVEVFAPPK
jgi:acetyl-CoA carboxylase beta subunit